jgi:hypothetical protein
VTNTAYRVTRDVPAARGLTGLFIIDKYIPGNWSDRDISEGERLYAFLGCDYGCVVPGGIAMTFNADGSGPFFEFPADAVTPE